ncbi:MAG: putative DNA binding domain-containing protein [Oscillospiraceae bacterium]|nr:putative DNA binding domain-containing protein [Oscillospiraceae bacterium]
MDFMTTKEAAELWGITIRRVQNLCDNGQIKDAAKLGDIWIIPKDAQKPVDGRIKQAKLENFKNMQEETILESQNVEWKETWRDEYMKTICGFANASGGVLDIGRNDDGVIVGIDGARKLMEDLPNKLRDAMGIIADVDIKDEMSRKYITITVKPYPYPISYHGKYYYRSGSTTQELTGNALDEFMLRKQGKTWDGVPIPRIKVSEIDGDAFKIFRRKAIESMRLTEQNLQITDEELLDTLQLTEGNYIKRAAILLFHQSPEKWVPGAYIKVGKFTNDADLLYQHEIHGPLISMVDKVMETVYLNYFKGIISYEGIQRVETFPVPHAAFREAITNAIVHRDYSTGIPIQIKVYDDKVIIYNDGHLPENLSVKDLLATHRSAPYNPFIASTFFRTGMIESWGRGIEKITEACRKFKNPDPIFEFKHNREFSVTFYSAADAKKDNTKNLVKEDTIEYLKDTTIDALSFTPNNIQRLIINLMAANPYITIKILSGKLGINERNVKNNIKILKEAGAVERIGANKNGYWFVKFYYV